MASKSKQKGSAFERKTCKELSMWISCGEREDLFWRSAMSGGRSTVALKKGKQLKTSSGDVSAIGSLGFHLTEKFLIECKHYKNLEFAALIHHRGKLIAFWQRAQVEAINHNQFPILIAKQNNYPTVVVMCRGGIKSFKLKYRKFDIIVPGFDMYIMTFDRFKQLNPKVLRKKHDG